MQYALIDNARSEANPGLKGTCPGCGALVLARCGTKRVHHWAHKGKIQCDPWWENETEWHRNWKSNFPIEWREVFHVAPDGERHIADVKTDQGYVLEFQRSPISPEERHARENFYKQMIWVVDGNKRLRDKDRFIDSLGIRIDGRDDVRGSPGGGHLLRDWGAKGVHVFFDFGEDTLWGLLPKTQEKQYCIRVTRDALIESLLPNTQSEVSFEQLLKTYTGTIAAHERYLERTSGRDILRDLRPR